ncbi:MAG: CoA transferase [Rickettsiales bacterium]|nr:CoA transferase [Rickettsiales bacterium]
MQPLKDVRVLSVTVYLAGPFLSMTMARFGAEVIKIETPGRGDPIRLNGPFAGPEGVHPTQQTDDDLTTKFLKRSEGVKSITLNLKDPVGKQMFLEMAKKSDVVLENLSPGSMKRLGLGYEDVAAVNSEIVYCSISGYGQEGPYANNPAHDHQIQAMSGMMDVNGEASGPPTRVGVFVGDLATPLYSAFAILAALRHRDQTGEGQYLDASMMDTLVTLMFMEPMEEILAQGLPVRAGNNARTDPTGLYRLTDGDIIITLASDERWKRLCGALEAEDILTNPRYATSMGRAEHIAAVRSDIQEKFSGWTVAQAIERLKNAGVPVAPVRTLSQVAEDPHFQQRGTLKPMRHNALDKPVKGGVVPGFPVQFSSGPLPQPRGGVSLGYDNEDVYKRLLGLDSENLANLKRNGTI